MRPSCSVSAAILTLIGFPVVAPAEFLFDGPEFQVNTYTTGAQRVRTASSVARSPDGGFVVVWTTYPVGGESTVRAQRYDSTGVPSGTEFQVNDPTTFDQLGPAVAAAADGGFVVAWTGRAIGQNGYPDHDGSDVFGRRFDSSGLARGTEFRVNSYTMFSQRDAAVGAADGGFVVAWTSVGADRYGDSTSQDHSNSALFRQKYDNSGARIGIEFRVNRTTFGAQSNAAVAVADDGRFVIVWSSFRQDGDGDAVVGLRYDGITEFRVNSYWTSRQSSPAVAAAADGRFVVAWTSGAYRYPGPDRDGEGVVAERFNSSGFPVGAEFQVNSHTTSDQGDPAVAVAADGSFVVVWTSRMPFGLAPSQDGDRAGIFGRRYDRSGIAVGTEFQINSYTTSSQDNPSVAVAADGEAVVVWQSRGQDGDDSGAFGQLLCVDANANAICDGKETARACGDSAESEEITASDALFVLRAAVELTECHACVCDTDASGSITAGDALRVLSTAVGRIVEMLCPVCP